MNAEIAIIKKAFHFIVFLTEGDDVLFDAHDSALLHVIVKGGSNEK